MCNITLKWLHHVLYFCSNLVFFVSYLESINRLYFPPSFESILNEQLLSNVLIWILYAKKDFTLCSVQQFIRKVVSHLNEIVLCIRLRNVHFTEDYDGALGVFTEMAYLAQESGGNCLQISFIDSQSQGSYICWVKILLSSLTN